MKLLLPLLLAPVLSLAAATGSVTLLDGTPIAGAVIKSLTDSVTTSATGTFALGRTSGISSRSAKTVPVTSHLTVENGRPRLSFAGMDIAGRARSSAIARQNLSNPGARFAARSTGTPDTLKVYWKGKRLTVLPITSDTTVTFHIDTAWKDDAGIPWNPGVAYGSLYDARDGQTYRTVTIGTQTWMAENLNFKWGNSTDSACIVEYISDESNDSKEDTMNTCRLSNNQLYSWPEAMQIDSSFNLTIWNGTSSKGICPDEWHIPSLANWKTLLPADTTLVKYDTLIEEFTFTSSKWAKSMIGWLNPGSDTHGLRIIPIHTKTYINGNLSSIEQAEYLWTSNQYTWSDPGSLEVFSGIQVFLESNSNQKLNNRNIEAYRTSTGVRFYKQSLRCLKD